LYCVAAVFPDIYGPCEPCYSIPIRTMRSERPWVDARDSFCLGSSSVPSRPPATKCPLPAAYCLISRALQGSRVYNHDHDHAQCTRMSTNCRLFRKATSYRGCGSWSMRFLAPWLSPLKVSRIMCVARNEASSLRRVVGKRK
jgi:hypothetical protein